MVIAAFYSNYISSPTIIEDAEIQAELKQVKNQLRGELCCMPIIGTDLLIISPPSELKDVNTSLKEENKSLREYIDRLLLIIMENSPNALAVEK